MENLEQNETIEINVKVKYLGEFPTWDTWINHVGYCGQQYGVTQQLLHIDSNGYNTTGYNLRNTNQPKVYPVKTYLLVQDPDVIRLTPFKTTTNS
jgi:hypothetical protein